MQKPPKNAKIAQNYKNGPKMAKPEKVQGDPKKMSVSVFELKSVLDVGFYFPAYVLELEF